MMKKSSFASRLVAWRQAKGLSQSGAAAELGVNLRTLQSWEMTAESRRSPILKTVEPVLERLAKDGF